MKQLFRPILTLALILSIITLASLTKPKNKIINHTTPPPPKIQVAVLLDVSGSMGGLIEQAKAQLWNMVSTMGKAQCGNNVLPQIEIALYEYGISGNAQSGYLNQINSFISDLDSLSQNLFNLKISGSSEYCGQVIFTSIKDLNWDASSSSYKVIFIAGNEDFLQGTLHYTQACNEAKNKGIIVNTIYCGDSLQGIREHWNLNNECGSGSYAYINQNSKIEEIPTPYDSMLFVLNDKLNKTYIAYGYGGAEKVAKQSAVDAANTTLSVAAGVKRINAKSGRVYNNADWDLVDAAVKDKDVVNKIDMKTLPDNLKNKSRKELQTIIDEKGKERGAIQKEIGATNAQREIFITAEKAKRATINKTATLETTVEKTIKEQAKRFNMTIQ